MCSPVNEKGRRAGITPILVSLTHSKQAIVKGLTTQAYKHAVQRVGCGCLLLWSVGGLLDQALCGPAGLTRTASDPGPGLHRDRSDRRVETEQTSGNLCIKYFTFMPCYCFLARRLVCFVQKLDCLHVPLAFTCFQCVMQFVFFPQSCQSRPPNNELHRHRRWFGN